MIRILATAIFALIFCVLAFFLRTQSCAQSETFTTTPPAQEAQESDETQDAEESEPGEESSEATEQGATSQEEASAEGSAQEAPTGTPESSKSANSSASSSENSTENSTANSSATPPVTTKERKKLDKEMKAMRKAFDKSDYDEALESASELIGWLRCSGFANAERGTEEDKIYRESLKEATELAAKAANHVEEPTIPSSKATYFQF